jgi:hypothetical protein
MSQTANTVIGIDIGKNSFHVAVHDARGAIALRQKWLRGQVEARLANIPPCLIGMEACFGAHHLSRNSYRLVTMIRLAPVIMIVEHEFLLRLDSTRQSKARAPRPCRRPMPATRSPSRYPWPSGDTPRDPMRPRRRARRGRPAPGLRRLKGLREVNNVGGAPASPTRSAPARSRSR